MIDYRLKDKARWLYRQGWEREEIEARLGIRCTDHIIPRWLQEQRYHRQMQVKKQFKKVGETTVRTMTRVKTTDPAMRWLMSGR